MDVIDFPGAWHNGWRIRFLRRFDATAPAFGEAVAVFYDPAPRVVEVPHREAGKLARMRKGSRGIGEGRHCHSKARRPRHLGGLHSGPDAPGIGVDVTVRLTDGRQIAHDAAGAVALEGDVRQQLFRRDGVALLCCGALQQATVLGRERTAAVEPLPDHAGGNAQQARGTALPAEEGNRFFEGGWGAHHPKD